MLSIGGRIISYNFKPFFVAEIGINHNGDINLAKRLIDAAVANGCDAVKFQKRTVEVVYSPEELAKPRESPFGTTNGDLKRALEFGKREYDQIDSYCKARKIIWFASPWDEESVNFLEQYDPPCYKIASACNLDAGLMGHIKSKGRPMIVSTGMTDEKMIDGIVKFLGEKNLIVLHCTATYPAKDHELHLANIPRMIKRYPRAFVGYSGHESSVYTSLVAAAFGACVIERHITLDRAMWGSDQAASLEIAGLKRLTGELGILSTIIGDGTKNVLESEIPVEKKLRKKNTLFMNDGKVN